MKNKVTQEMVDELLSKSEVVEFEVYDKVLLVEVKLPNGFTVAGRGACVDPANYSKDIGRKVAMEDVSNQVWRLLGYELQCCLFGANLSALSTFLQ